MVERKKEKKPHLAQFTIPKRLNVIDEYENEKNFCIIYYYNFFFLKKKSFSFYSFFPIFNFIYQLTDDEESISYITESVIHDFKKDGVRYLELRTTPRNGKNGMYVAIISYLICVIQCSNQNV